MKFNRSSKLMTSLLLTAFLVTSVGAIMGYVWCLGDDGHVEVNYTVGNDCCDDGHVRSPAEHYDGPTISQANTDHCGSCLDFSAQNYEAVFFKRLKRTSPVSLEPLSPNNSLTSAMQSVRLATVNHSRQPSLRIAQAILFQRTVVLLS
jgi:hypothetical protein